MRRSNNGILLLGLLFISLVVVIIILSSFTGESDQDLYLRDVKEVEAVTSKMIETNFQQELITALKNEGYKPTGSIAYTIFSMDKKELTVVLHGIDTSRRKAENYIQDLTNQLSTSIGLGNFDVTVVEDKD
ncbi:hypothetical protein M9R32_14735 [Paenisporosarcina quisquiliarum]|jgi:hypothetical protein|uniref:Uncharacterized protein n=1 Tax=Paenisporosarcina quisquiliarum TaxID=365346 RepID=A0A9X3LJ81_9BACL|nr:hypothetical protein [Paenisporosarcina quisquiliarum]MCZ8538450.1 hypothetical protein [Paenisporosarcina quisquiliarum]